MIEKKILTKIAYYYYKLELTQNEIAQRLGMSRQRVNRLLKRCREEGIVEIRIAGFEESFVELEGELESKYGLKQVIITPEAETGQLYDVLGAAAADYAGEIIATQSIIGISWGRTMYSMAQHMPSRSPGNPELKVVQLVGNMGELNRDVQPDEVTRLFASKLGASPVLLYAPVYIKNKVAKFTLVHEESIKSVLELMPLCESVFLSISGIQNNYTWLNQTVIEDEYIRELREKRAVGNICLRYFDEDGTCIDSELHRLEIGITGETLKSIPNVVCAAGGEDKYDALYSAIKGGFINTLITDKATADFLNRQQPL
ncbi:MAG: sugar-binding transcriptional regulator [Spirochaetales bacterium]|uniref:Sugar-binding transcriptional regulator n=1 Tax=Candidatus Thalassospirochaeta sargassi TaxID=3119039 RepID=A0AAJ1MN41_9SPIO|nr:sugar-binding transcriptional regulator [Spirochaetales bacterium]